MREEPKYYKVLIMILTVPVFLLNSQPNSHHLDVPEGTMNDVRDSHSEATLRLLTFVMKINCVSAGVTEVINLRSS